MVRLGKRGGNGKKRVETSSGDRIGYVSGAVGELKQERERERAYLS